MKVAAYQAPLYAIGSIDVLDLIRQQIDWCESNDVEILCCPEGVLGGLADYANHPANIAINVESGQLHSLLAPLASDKVSTIIGFTEVDRAGRLYNSAAVFHKGMVIGIYRKLYPAINRSVYEAGDKMPVFTIGDLTFGIIICLDSNYYEPARIMASQGAAALFVPTNNGLPHKKGGPELAAQARNVDIARAIENSVFVIRADVAGRTESLMSYGASGIVNPDGRVIQSARQLGPNLIVANIKTAPRKSRRGWDASRNSAVMDEYIRLLTRVHTEAESDLKDQIAQTESKNSIWRNDPEMTANDVIEIVQLFNQNNIDFYIDGGWGVDALVGEQTRTHADLDIAAQHKDVARIRALLEAKGFKDLPRDDTRDCNFVLGDSHGHQIDIHSYTFDSSGNHVYGVEYPYELLTGSGSINGLHVKCISPEWMVKFHTGYKFDENDYRDVKILCQKFDIKMPSEYEAFERSRNE